MHHFISYSRPEAGDFVLSLTDALRAGPPTVEAWLDQRKLRPGDDWDSQIDQAIRTCRSLIFVMTPDSVAEGSVCKAEWTRALKFKKPVVPLLLHADAEAPFRLGERQHVDFTSDFDTGLARLRQHLQWLDTPEGNLAALKDRLTDARRSLRRAAEDQRPRIQKEIDELQGQIRQQETIVQDPQAAAERVQRSIDARIESERQPARPVGGKAQTIFINPPPMVAPDYFQDRFVETRLLADFLRDDALRLMSVIGRGGIGKTAMVCRLLKALERGELPDDLGPFSVAGIVYLSQIGSHRVTVANLFADLCRLLPAEEAQQLETLYRDAKVSTREKVLALLDGFQARRGPGADGQPRRDDRSPDAQDRGWRARRGARRPAGGGRITPSR